MTLQAKRALVFGMLLALTACVGWMPKRGSGPVVGGSPGSDRGLPSASSGPAQVTGISKKAVFGKREPVTLIARDRTECVVSESRFKESAIGEDVRCEWRTP